MLAKDTVVTMRSRGSGHLSNSALLPNPATRILGWKTAWAPRIVWARGLSSNSIIGLMQAVTKATWASLSVEDGGRTGTTLQEGRLIG